MEILEIRCQFLSVSGPQFPCSFLPWNRCQQGFSMKVIACDPYVTQVPEGVVLTPSDESYADRKSGAFEYGGRGDSPQGFQKRLFLPLCQKMSFLVVTCCIL